MVETINPALGKTKRLKDILAAVTRQFAERADVAATTIRSVMIGDDRSHSQFKHAFDCVLTVPPTGLPGGLEIFVVPGHLAYVAIHIPIKGDGFPIPFGVLSFDPKLVVRAQSVLKRILSSQGATVRHCTWKAKISSVSSVACLVMISQSHNPEQLKSKGQVQEEELDSCRPEFTGEVGQRDEGPGETEGVSPGAISRSTEMQSGPGRIRGQNGGVYAAFFLVVSFFAVTFAAVGFGLLEPSALALTTWGFFVANTSSASVSKSGWYS